MSLLSRAVGPPPQPGAPKSAVLRHLRRISLVWIIAVALCAAAAALKGGTAIWIGVGVITLIWLAGLIWLTIEIRRARRDEERIL
jgi:Flp pilus assembly protein TadB